MQETQKDEADVEMELLAQSNVFSESPRVVKRQDSVPTWPMSVNRERHPIVNL